MSVSLKKLLLRLSMEWTAKECGRKYSTTYIVWIDFAVKVEEEQEKFHCILQRVCKHRIEALELHELTSTS